MVRLAFLAALLIGVNAAQGVFYDPVTPDSGPAPQFGAYVIIDRDRGISVPLVNMTLGRVELTFLNALYNSMELTSLFSQTGVQLLLLLQPARGVDEVIEGFTDTAGTAFLDDILPRLVDLNDFNRRPFKVGDGAEELLWQRGTSVETKKANQSKQLARRSRGEERGMGALGLLAAAVVYSACGLGAYFHHRQRRRDFKRGWDALIAMIIKWPLLVIQDAYDVMQWGSVPPRFLVYVVPRLDGGLFAAGRAKDLGWFRKWDEAVKCAHRNAKELSGAVWISDSVRPWMYCVDRAGEIERRRIVEG